MATYRRGRGPRFVQVPWELQDDPQSDAFTVAVYAALRRFCDFGKECGAVVSDAVAAQKAGCSERTFRARRAWLRDRGWIEWESASGRTNNYVVHSSPSDAEPRQEVPGSPNPGTWRRTPRQEAPDTPAGGAGVPRQEVPTTKKVEEEPVPRASTEKEQNQPPLLPGGTPPPAREGRPAAAATAAAAAIAEMREDLRTALHEIPDPVRRRSFAAAAAVVVLGDSTASWMDPRGDGGQVPWLERPALLRIALAKCNAEQRWGSNDLHSALRYVIPQQLDPNPLHRAGSRNGASSPYPARASPGIRSSPVHSRDEIKAAAAWDQEHVVESHQIRRAARAELEAEGLAGEELEERTVALWRSRVLERRRTQREAGVEDGALAGVSGGALAGGER